MMNLCADYDDVKKPGDASVYTRMKMIPHPTKPGIRVSSREIESYGLHMCCPQCGKSTTGPHKYNKETKSLTPSIVHSCGYHGYLTNGMFTLVK